MTSRPPEQKKQRMSEPTVEDIMGFGREMMNRGDKRVGATMTEDKRFREFFGCGALVALVLWKLLVQHALLPPGACIVHMLWALTFLKTHGKETDLAAKAGGGG